MAKLAGWIKQHQVVAFFLIAFAITWGLGFSYVAVYRGAFLMLPLGVVSLCGPALAGIIITAVTNTESRQGSRRSQWIVFLIAWAVSAAVFVAHTVRIDHSPFSVGMVVVVSVSVVPVAFVISTARSRIPAVKRYVSSLVRLRGVEGWSLLALGLYAALHLLTLPISRLLGKPFVAVNPLLRTGLALMGLIVVKFLYQFLFFNATGEEVGWRGFALPRLQARVSPLIASLIVTVFWIPWHLFLWKAQGVPVMTWKYWIGTNSLLIILSSVVLTWFYNHSRGSILVVGIAHAAENSTARLLFIQDWTTYLVLKAIVVVVMILADRMWRRLPRDHPTVYCESAVELPAAITLQ
ncbi:MAG: CPBP family intramembrane metalloprotease [Anaerolineae bacterium]|nr:CPBP family intramembrane metalloprotease [Anaerolineae bacterium]